MGNIFKNVIKMFSTSSDPSSPAAGDVWYRSDLGRMRVRNGSASKSVAFTDEISGALRQYYASGSYYNQHMANVVPAGNQVITAGTIYYSQMYIFDNITMDRVGVNVTTLGAGSTIRLGLYSITSSGKPGALVADYGTVASTTTGTKEITISQAVTPGLYYFAVLSTATAPGVSSVNVNYQYPATGSTAFSIAATGVTGYTQSSTSLPSTATPVASVGFCPMVWFRAA